MALRYRRMGMGNARDSRVKLGITVFSWILGAVVCISLWGIVAEARRLAKASQHRRPAAASPTCSEAGCACEGLKVLSDKCATLTADREITEIRSIFAELTTAAKADQEERRHQNTKVCPYSVEAETCRQKLKKTIVNYKPRNSSRKVSVTQDLGIFGIELIESVNKNPRAPANSR